MYNVYCTIYIMQYFMIVDVCLFNMQVQCTMYNVQCTIYNVYCTIYIMQYFMSVDVCLFNMQVKYTIYDV